MLQIRLVTPHIMKYICLGYFDESKWETMSESEQRAFMDECFAFDDEWADTFSVAKRSKARDIWQTGDGSLPALPGTFQ